MTPADLEKLRRIDAHLERLLALASKRTPGEWFAESSRAYCEDESITHNVIRPPSDFMYLQELPDAAFIAACAGNAEAGWKATRAAVACVLVICDPASGADFTNYGGETLLPQILAALPNI